MARIRKCDRCKKTYEPYEGDFNSIGTATYNMDNEQLDVTTDYDLCPACNAEFKAWFEAHGAKLEQVTWYGRL